MKTKNNLHRRIVCMMAGMILILCGLFMATDRVDAMTKTTNPQPSHSWYQQDPNNNLGPGRGTEKKLSKCVPGIKVIGEAYLHGGNNNVEKEKITGTGVGMGVKSLVNSEEERYDYKIQGKSVDYRWIIYNNTQHLYNLHHEARLTGQGSRYESDIQIGWYYDSFDPHAQEYKAVEGEKYEVVEYNDDYVTIWSPGYKAYGADGSNSTVICKAWLLYRSHPAGFYKIPRNKVWLNIYANDEYISEKAAKKYVADGRVTTNTIKISQKPSQLKSGYSYVCSTDSVRVLDTTPIPSETAGDKTKYYKCAFLGGNEVYYMSYRANVKNSWYVVYIDSRCLNLYPKNKKLPASATKAKIGGVAKDQKYLNPTSDIKGKEAIEHYFQNGAKIDTFPEKSSKSRVAFWFNGKIRYINAKYVKYYIDEAYVKNIVNNNYVIGWDKVPVTTKVAYITGTDKNTIKRVDLKGNTKTYTVKSNKINLKQGNYTKVTAQVGTEHDTKTYGQVELLYPFKVDNLWVYDKGNNFIRLKGTTSHGSVVQWSTNKNFKNAKQKKVKDDDVLFENLKKNTTYYFRVANYVEVKTANGKKMIRSPWKKITVKTKGVTVKPVTISSASSQSGIMVVKWKKYSGKADYLELMFSTDKKFKNKNTTYTLTAGKKDTKRENGFVEKGKTYYVKIRAVSNADGGPYYSSWSKVKKVKI